MQGSDQSLLKTISGFLSPYSLVSIDSISHLCAQEASIGQFPFLVAYLPGTAPNVLA